MGILPSSLNSLERRRIFKVPFAEKTIHFYEDVSLHILSYVFISAFPAFILIGFISSNHSNYRSIYVLSCEEKIFWLASAISFPLCPGYNPLYFRSQSYNYACQVWPSLNTTLEN